MPIAVTCANYNRLVDLDTGAGQRLHYRVTATGDVTFKMRDHERSPMLSGSGPGIMEVEWPQANDDMPRSKQLVHGIGMRIAGKGTMRWEVELRDAGGEVLSVVRDCTYTNAVDTSTKLDLVEISLV